MDSTTDATNLEPVAEQEVETPEIETEAELEGDGLEGEEQEQAEEEEEELDIDGKPLRVAKSVADALKARMMMQADYTQKTQSLAEQRREYEQQRQALEWEAQTKQELFKEEAQLHTVRERLQQFQNVNWQAAWQQNPQQAGAMQAEYTQLKDYHDQLYGHVEGRKTELQTKREHEDAIALESALKLINTPKPDIGWDGQFTADKREKITKFAVERLGYAPEQISKVKDARDVMTLNLALIGLDAIQKQRQTPTRPVAQVAAKVPTSRATASRDPAKMSMEQYASARKSGRIT